MIQKVFFPIALASALAVSLFLPLSVRPGFFNTPDEQANSFFTDTFITHGELRVLEPLERIVDNAIHPRSVNVIHGFLVPESFLGLPLFYGFLGRALHVLSKGIAVEQVFYAVVSIITIVALSALSSIIYRTWGADRGRLSFYALLLCPPFLYWLGRPFMHTILFFDFLVLGMWMLLRTRSWHLIAGMCIGVALAMRTSEVLWVGVVVLCCVVYTKKPWRIISSAVATGVGIVLILGPLLLLNHDLYGTFFGSGYSVTESRSLGELSTLVPLQPHASLVMQVFLPFGFHPVSALHRFWYYAVGGIWWYVVPMMMGALIVMVTATKSVSAASYNNVTLTERPNGYRDRNRYTIVWLLLSLYLILVYGSFNAEVFADPRHPLGASIGSPYLRYWLPIFLFGAPFVAVFLTWFMEQIRKRSRLKFFILHSSFFILAAVFSLRAVFWHGPESALAIQEATDQFVEMRERIVRGTPENAVFIVPRFADRIIFPARKVIVDMEGKDMIGIIRTLHAHGSAVYWMRGKGEIALEPALSEHGIKLKRRFDLDPKGKLYEINL